MEQENQGKSDSECKNCQSVSHATYLCVWFEKGLRFQAGFSYNCKELIILFFEKFWYIKMLKTKSAVICIEEMSK